MVSKEALSLVRKGGDETPDNPDGPVGPLIMDYSLEEQFMPVRNEITGEITGYRSVPPLGDFESYTIICIEPHPAVTEAKPAKT